MSVNINLLIVLECISVDSMLYIIVVGLIRK